MTQKHSALRVVSREGIGVGHTQTARINPKRRVALHLDNAIHLLDISDICRCEADGNYCRIYTVDGRKAILSKTLGYILKRLPSKTLIRTHQSHAINISMVSTVHKDHIVLSNGDNIPLSRSRRSEIQEIIHSQMVCL